MVFVCRIISRSYKASRFKYTIFAPSKLTCEMILFTSFMANRIFLLIFHYVHENSKVKCKPTEEFYFEATYSITVTRTTNARFYCTAFELFLKFCV